ncbi:beta-propeller domain-containing protein [Oceanobacillus polygoni]|uniref:beta-propeller domain-containing protein n=1 Tax=Oceanobacillus polygoni TaxID=1235259 RepID=UPI002482D898|nr:beta-propeller domain-containing protein [Oceanobacillus polygoni]
MNCELNNNHKALFKHPDSNLFGFPATLYESKYILQGDSSYEMQSFIYEGAFLYNITAEDGITLYDTITHQQKERTITLKDNRVIDTVALPNSNNRQ